MINLISDTVTRPTPGMLQAMMSAAVGDDVFREDPTTHALEEKCAALFGHEAGLFCPSGTMANQIAIKVHTKPLDEVVCDVTSHIYQYEVGGYAFHSGIAVSLLPGKNGLLTAEMVQGAVKPSFDWLPRTRLVVLENTANRGGGSCYDIQTIQQIRKTCIAHGLALHLDGARIFNAMVAKGYSPLQIGAEFDSISMCLSKGLGTPVGSVLTGDKAFIAEARRVRKAMGGGMRQTGYLAAAGIYALDHHVARLQADHDHAAMIAGALAGLDWVANIRPVETNIVIFDLVETISPATFIDYLKAQGINASAFGAQSVRFVTHLDISRDMIDAVIRVLRLFRQ